MKFSLNGRLLDGGPLFLDFETYRRAYTVIISSWYDMIETREERGNAYSIKRYAKNFLKTKKCVNLLRTRFFFLRGDMMEF